MAHRLYPVLEGRDLHSYVIVAVWLVPSFSCFLFLILEKSKPARVIRQSHELEGGVDATGSENPFGTSCVVQGVLDGHETVQKEGGHQRRTHVNICEDRAAFELNSNGKGLLRTR